MRQGQLGCWGTLLAGCPVVESREERSGWVFRRARRVRGGARAHLRPRGDDLAHGIRDRIATRFDGRAGHARPVRPAAARPADLGHRSLQLPVPVLHARRGLRARLRVPAARRDPDVRGDPAAGRACSSGSASGSCGSPAASRRSGAACRTSSRCSPRCGRPRASRSTCADDERLGAARARAAARRRRPAADHGLARLARRRGVPADERRRLPGRRRSSTGSTPRSRRAWRRSRSTSSSSAARTRTGSCRWRAGRATRATSSGSSSTWTSGRRTAGASTRSCRRPRSSRRSTPSCRSSRSPPSYRGEVAERWRYLDGAARSGVIASVTRPFCGDCTRARLSAEGKLYTCLFSAVGHDLRAPLRSGRRPTTSSPTLVAAIWARPRRSLLRAARRRDRAPPEDRDVRPRRLGSAPTVRAVVHASSTAVRNSWTRGGAARPKLVDNPVGPRAPGP